jgi:hypothetical protein
LLGEIHFVLFRLFSRDGRLQIGDEIINVNGCRLRGVGLQEARDILQNSPKEVSTSLGEFCYSSPDAEKKLAVAVAAAVVRRHDGRELHGHGREQSFTYTDSSSFLTVATSLLRFEYPVVTGLGFDPQTDNAR